MLNTVLQYLVGIGVIQAFLLGLVLFWKPGSNVYISRLTGVVLWLTMLLMGSELIDLFDQRNSLMWIHTYSILLDLLLVVLVWHISLFILGIKKRYKRKDLIHLLPLIIGVIWFHTGFRWYGVESPGTFSHIPDAVGIFVGYKGIIWIGYMSSTIYHYFHSRSVKGSIPYNLKNNLFQSLIWPFIAILAISLISFWLMFFGYPWIIDSDNLGVILIVVYVYFLSFSILVNPSVHINFKNPETVPKYRSSGLGKAQAEEYVNRLNFYMDQEKPYLDTKLSLPELAQAIGISPNVLSQLINETMGKNFNDLVNHYRLEAFKVKLMDPSESHKTLLALALESGFQSKASFNRVFKNSEGMTPSSYKRLLLSHPTR